MKKSLLFAIITGCSIIQFPFVVKAIYGLPDPVAIFVALLNLFGSMLAYDLVEHHRQESTLMELVRYFFSPLSYVATVHHGQFPFANKYVVLSALMAIFFSTDPLTSIRKLCRRVGRHTAWYSGQKASDFEIAFGAFNFIAFLIVIPIYFINKWS